MFTDPESVSHSHMRYRREEESVGKVGVPLRADGVAGEKKNASHLSRQVYRAMRGPHFLP